MSPMPEFEQRDPQTNVAQDMQRALNEANLEIARQIVLPGDRLKLTRVEHEWREAEKAKR